MMRIELDWVLEYLATGEQADLVLQVLGVQEDAAELLAQARAAIAGLSEGKPGGPVRSRLARAARAIRRNPNASGRSEVFSVARPAGDMAPPRPFVVRAMSASVFEPAPASEPAAGGSGDISGAIGRGAREYADLGAVILDRGHPNPVRLEDAAERPHDLEAPAFLRRRRPDLSGKESILFAKAASQMPPPLDYSPAANLEQEIAEDRDISLDVDAVRLPARDGGGGGVLLWASGQGRSAQVVVQVEEPNGPEIAQVLWLSDEGVVARASTDGAGIASLPWPAPGPGQLRVDAGRTYVVKVRVDK